MVKDLHVEDKTLHFSGWSWNWAAEDYQQSHKQQFQEYELFIPTQCGVILETRIPFKKNILVVGCPRIVLHLKDTGKEEHWTLTFFSFGEKLMLWI